MARRYSQCDGCIHRLANFSQGCLSVEVLGLVLYESCRFLCNYLM